MIPKTPYTQKDANTFYDTTETTESKRPGCYATAIVGIVVVVVWMALTSGSSGSSRPSYSSSSHDAGMACIMAEKLIKRQLKSPTSAEFDYGDCRDNATQSGNIWTLRSYVDADNSFGAHIRTYYIAKLSNVPPSDTWRLEDVQFLD